MLRHSRSYDKHSNLAFIPYSDSVLSFEVSDNHRPAYRPTVITNHERFTDARSSHGCYFMSNICNGLICLFDYFSRRVGLFNIQTRDFIPLPAVTTTGGCRHIRVWYALGFDPLSKVYKVLSIYGGYDDECGTKAATLTVGIGSRDWKPVEYKFLRSAATMKPGFWRSRNRFCFDGVIYWVNGNEIDDISVLTVSAFDLNREVFRDYKLDTIPIRNVARIRYYLTTLKGNPTLFIWQKNPETKESDEIQQLTLLNHENPNAAWTRRSFTSDDFPRNYPFGNLWYCVAGGSILLRAVKPYEQDNSLSSWYNWYDLENFAIE